MKTRDIHVRDTHIEEFCWRMESKTVVTADGFLVDMDFNEAVLRVSNGEWLTPIPF